MTKEGTQGMEIRNPEYMDFVEGLFENAAFIAEVGFRLVDASPGWCASAYWFCPSTSSRTGMSTPGYSNDG